MFPILESLQSHKFDHEEKARQGLIDKFKNPKIKKAFEQGGLKGEHRICVFGRTKVGKTTLILRLLGYDTENMRANGNLTLDKALRGNKDKNDAGTATATRYYIGSDEDKGKIKYPYKPNKRNQEISFSNLKELEEHLQDVRNRVEGHRWNATDPLIIELPSKYFKVDGKDSKWAITDIPGIESSKANEQKHVSELLETWVATSNVLLVMGKASQIYQLNNLTLPVTHSWKNSRRCRLIITHAFSEESIRNKLKSGNLTNKNFNIFYADEIKEQGINLDGINSVYPLEYGESWIKLESNHPEVYKKVKPERDELLNNLRKSLDNSLDPEEEFKCLMDIANLEKIFEKEIKKEETAINNDSKKLENTKKNLIAYNNKLVDQTNQIKDINTEIESWNKKNKIVFGATCFTISVTDYDYDETCTCGFKKFQEKLEDEFKKDVENYSYAIFENKQLITTEEGFGGFGDWKTYCKKDKFKKWDGDYHQNNLKKIGRTGNWFGRAKEAHSIAFKKMVPDQQEKWTEEINRIRSKIICRKIKELNTELKIAKTKLRICKRLINYSRENGKRMERIISDKKERIKKKKENKVQDFSLFRNEYPSLRARELKRSLGDQFRELNQSTDPTEQLQRLAFAYQISSISKSME